MRPTPRIILTHAAAFCLGSLLLLGTFRYREETTHCSRTYDLLNPQLQCEKGFTQGEWDYEPLRNALLEEKAALKGSGKLSHLSIYFRDLDHGPRFGIGEYDKFHPASLRKVPVLIAYLHLADLDPAILDKTLSYTGALKMNQNIDKPEETIRPNTLYSVHDLLLKMIVYSDNYSYTILTNALNVTPPKIPYYTFRDLDVLRMMMDPRGDFVSIQSYANLFAVLYNTGYLSKEMSQYALDLLSRATFKDGLAAGVPMNTRVAHKFGQRLVGTESELHDCGIVYHPNMSYVLCVMTSGKEGFETQQSAIAEVSRTVYDSVSALSFGGTRQE